MFPSTQKIDGHAEWSKSDKDKHDTAYFQNLKRDTNELIH